MSAQDERYWFNARQAARHLCFDGKSPADAFRKWALRAGVLPRGSRGAVKLWHRDDLDAAVVGAKDAAQLRRHRLAETLAARDRIRPISLLEKGRS